MISLYLSKQNWVCDGEFGLENPLGKVRSVADFQFGKGVGAVLFPEGVEFEYSKRTGRIRFINLNGERLATLRPTDGLLSLEIKAAKPYGECARCQVLCNHTNDVSKYTACAVTCLWCMLCGG